MPVRDDLDFQYAADVGDGAYVLPADDPAAQRYDADTIVTTLTAEGWTVVGSQTRNNNQYLKLRCDEPALTAAVGWDLAVETGTRLSPLKQYEVEHILRGGDSPDTVAGLVAAEQDGETALLYDYDLDP